LRTTDGDICSWSGRRLVGAIADRSVSAVEVLETHLARIDDRNPLLNAVVTLDADRAYIAARTADATVARGGRLGRLHGVPFAVKDLVDTAGLRTTYGSRVFADHVPEADGLLVQRLRAAGAVIVGKTNTPEFGAGSQTVNEVFGPTRNPYDPSLTAGGSSGGAAAAVATGMVPLADGSDLAASVRNPASFCGTVGLRPSPGRIPQVNVQADPWDSLSVIGPIARSVDDVALLLGVLAGREARDPRSIAASDDLGAPVVAAELHGLRVAWSRNLIDLPVARVVTEALEPRRAQLRRLGAAVDDAEPDLRDADQVFDTLRAVGFAGLAAVVESHGDLVKESVRWNVTKGLALTGREIAEAHALRARVYSAMRSFMAGYDVLALPTAQVAPFSVEHEWVREIEGVEMEHYVAWLRSCSRISVTGHPAISITAAWTPAGLPVGLQLVGHPLGERRLLEIAAALEAAFRVDESPCAGATS
jgi:amidase